MQILGFHKLSLVDYPEKLCSVVFTGGCNFQCPYCHNKNIVKRFGDFINEEALEKTLLSRKKYVSNLCISGGEPTLQKDLVDFIKKYKEQGFNIKLDTNGSDPGVLQELLDKKYLDYVAMDLKTDINHYEKVIGKSGYKKQVEESIRILKNSSIDYEFRTTFVKELMSPQSIEGLKQMVQNSKRFTLQNVRLNDEVLSPKVPMQSYSKEEMVKFKKEFEPYVETIRLNL